MPLFLELLALGDVLFDRDKMAGFPAGPLDGGDGHFLDIKGSVFAPVD